MSARRFEGTSLLAGFTLARVVLTLGVALTLRAAWDRATAAGRALTATP